jgi:membrane fusion protein, copper/silver efflux system
MTKTQKLMSTSLLIALMAAGIVGAYWFGVHRGMGQAGGGADPSMQDPTSSIAAGEAATRRHIVQGIKAGQIDPANGQAVLYYHDPMVPGKRFDAPAKSPFMDMMLVPVYAGAAAQDRGTVVVSPRIQQNLGLRTAEVVEGTLRPSVTAVGSIAWNQRDQSVVQARAAGFIEKLYVRAEQDHVRQGQPFADVYVPEWVAAQEEYLGVRRFASADTVLIAAARQRLLLAGMNEAQVARIETAGKVQPRITLTVPASGVIAELSAREGMTVMPGMMLARIHGLATVWAVAELPESQAALVQPGSAVELSGPGVPGTVYRGTLQALLPEVNPVTRTLKARVQLANPGGYLVPGLFVNMKFADVRSAKALLVPTEAVIQTGRRAVVMLAEEGGRFAPVDVDTGLEFDGQTEVKRGLKSGQRVVVSSQFLIDSEASLKGVEARLSTEPMSAMPAASGASR